MTRKSLARTICAASGVLALAALLSVPSLAQKSDYPSGAAVRGSAGHHGGTHGYFDPKPGTPDPAANRGNKSNAGGSNAGGGGTGSGQGSGSSGNASSNSSQNTAGSGTQ